MDVLDFLGEVAAALTVATVRRNPNQKALSPNGQRINLPYVKTLYPEKI
ncbi:hypothetical protein [Nostoc favosum]|uniref:Uncharacterized protein n=1 Tax=Nostoc favosum CHAB5714 TaxID=2780399 RepID=A0ABS8I8U4_9NOSO|nr:hypothetical protein [Nostoc favosum]MCC5600426.1 hypothetical protein [Nostoc favosum CHAB5714]